MNGKNIIESRVLNSVSTFKKQDVKFVGVRSFFIVFILLQQKYAKYMPEKH
jgi:hypothetical protein